MEPGDEATDSCTQHHLTHHASSFFCNADSSVWLLGRLAWLERINDPSTLGHNICGTLTCLSALITPSLVSFWESQAQDHQQWPRLAHCILIEAKAVMEPIARPFNMGCCIQSLDHTGLRGIWHILIQVAGWAYFAAWSLSFYPQAGRPLLILKAVLMWLLHGSQFHAISCETASWSRASSACWVQTHLHRHLHWQHLPSTSWVLLD